MADIEKVLQGLEHCLNHYDCKTCPYATEYDPSLDCIAKTRKDALELLKEQQPRIMRLPEAMGIYDPVFAEFKKMDGDTFTKWVDAVISDDARHVKVTDLYCIIPTIREMEFDFNLYNKRFRFWSKKPTDEQMASEPWN